jgi:hypothetical protein
MNLFGRVRGLLGQTTRNVLVQYARDQRLVWHPFFECLDLNIAQVARGQSNIDPTILDAGCARGGLESRKLGFRGDRFELALFIGTENCEFGR